MQHMIVQSAAVDWAVVRQHLYYKSVDSWVGWYGDILATAQKGRMKKANNVWANVYIFWAINK